MFLVSVAPSTWGRTVAYEILGQFVLLASATCASEFVVWCHTFDPHLLLLTLSSNLLNCNGKYFILTVWRSIQPITGWAIRYQALSIKTKARLFYVVATSLDKLSLLCFNETLGQAHWHIASTFLGVTASLFAPSLTFKGSGREGCRWWNDQHKWSTVYFKRP